MSSSLPQTTSGLSFGAALKSVFSKYATFSGRATRSEYWWWVLLQALVNTVLSIVVLIGVTLTAAAAISNSSVTVSNNEAVSVTTGDSVVSPAGVILLIIGFSLIGLWNIGTLLPSLAVSIRRFHDAGYSGWFWLFNFIPSVGSIVVLVFMLLPTQPADNQWGLAPVPAK